MPRRHGRRPRWPRLPALLPCLHPFALLLRCPRCPPPQQSYRVWASAPAAAFGCFPAAGSSRPPGRNLTARLPALLAPGRWLPPAAGPPTTPHSSRRTRPVMAGCTSLMECCCPQPRSGRRRCFACHGSPLQLPPLAGPLLPLCRRLRQQPLLMLASCSLPGRCVLLPFQCPSLLPPPSGQPGLATATSAKVILVLACFPSAAETCHGWWMAYQTFRRQSFGACLMARAWAAAALPTRQRPRSRCPPRRRPPRTPITLGWW